MNGAQVVARAWTAPNKSRSARRTADRDPPSCGFWLNGLRVSEACDNIEDLAVQRGHCTLRILGKGSKPATIPLVPRTARTIDLVVGERHEGPILRRKDGQRLDRRTAHRWVRSMANGRTRSRPSAHAPRGFIMAALDAGVPLRMCSAARHADPRRPRSADPKANTWSSSRTRPTSITSSCARSARVTRGRSSVCHRTGTRVRRIVRASWPNRVLCSPRWAA